MNLDPVCSEPAGASSCTVKWFDRSKGFGFLTPDDGGSDILLHVRVLLDFGMEFVDPPARLWVTVESTQKGRRASSILAIVHPDKECEPGMGLVAGIEEQLSPFSPARVKWYSVTQDYGFANAFNDQRDILLPGEVLRRRGLLAIEAGEALALRAAARSKGLIAVDVRPWCKVTSDADLGEFDGWF